MSSIPSKLQLKIFASTPAAARPPALETFIPIFHQWIKDHVLQELAIDVANYAHVPKGPGVVLIGHNCDYFVDESEGRLGLLHNRKRGSVPAESRLEDLVRRTLHAAALLEKEPALGGALAFSPKELLFRINDRLAGPPTDATFAVVRPELEALGRRLFSGPFELTRVGDAKSLFAVKMLSPGESAPLGALLTRLGGPPVPDLP
jgi:hypothetical protein